jgi:hypothetical protein
MRLNIDFRILIQMYTILIHNVTAAAGSRTVATRVHIIS